MDLIIIIKRNYQEIDKIEKIIQLLVIAKKIRFSVVVDW